MRAGPAVRGRLEIIQALRGIAALAVVGFHIRNSLGAAGDRLFSYGYAGVDLFFVISGFIMVHTTRALAGTPRDALRFLVKRLARIWPVYVVATLAYVVVRGFSAHYFGTWSGVLQLGKAFVFYPQARRGPPWLGFAPDEVGWTLNYEVAFYLLFTLALLAGRWRYRVLAGSFITLLVVVPLLVTGHVHADAYGDYGLHPAYLELLANPLLWEFLAGVGIALLYHSSVRVPPAAGRAFAAIATCAVVAQYAWHLGFGYGPTHVGALLALLVLTLALADKARPFRVPRWLVWLGDASFSLYLLHRVAQILLAREAWGTSLQPLLDTPVFFVVSTAFALALAELSRRWLENGLAEWTRRGLLRWIG